MRPYGPCTEVDIGVDARIDDRLRMTVEVGVTFVTSRGEKVLLGWRFNILGPVFKEI